MKKILALVMATLMILGVVAVPAFADFAGSEGVTITYDDATNTLNVLLSAKAFNKVYSAKKFSADDYNALLPDELVEAYKENGIVGVLSSAALKGIITREQIFEIIPESIFANPDSITAANIKANKEMLKGIIADFYANIYSLEVNGLETLSEDPQTFDDLLDIGAVEKAFLAGLPKDSAAFALDPTFALKAKFDFGSQKTEFNLKVGFEGTTDELAALKANLQAITARLMYKIDGTKITVTGKAAKEQSDYVKKFLASDVADATKLEVLLALNGTVKNLVDIIANRTLDELQDIASKLNNDNIDKVNEFIDNNDEKAQKAYAKLLDYLNKSFADKLEKDVASFYNGNGEFNYDKAFAYTTQELVDLLSQKTEAAEQALDYLTGSVALDIETNLIFEDLFKTTFHIGEQTFAVYMPCGVDFADIMKVLATAEEGTVAKQISKIATWGKSTDNGVTFTAAATLTADVDMDVYPCVTVDFVDNAGTKTLVLPVGTTLQAFDIPAPAEKSGFTAGQWYLEGDKTKAPLNYVVNSNVKFVVDYTAVETTAEETTEPTNPPTGIDDVKTANNSLVIALAIAAVVASAGVVVCIKRKEEN